jgi:hypothetical protein
MYVIMVEEKGCQKHRQFYVKDDGLITNNLDEAAKFPKRHEWAVITLCSHWNKMNDGYIYREKEI